MSMRKSPRSLKSSNFREEKKEQEESPEQMLARKKYSEMTNKEKEQLMQAYINVELDKRKIPRGSTKGITVVVNGVTKAVDDLTEADKAWLLENRPAAQFVDDPKWANIPDLDDQVNDILRIVNDKIAALEAEAMQSSFFSGFNDFTPLEKNDVSDVVLAMAAVKIADPATGEELEKKVKSEKREVEKAMKNVASAIVAGDAAAAQSALKQAEQSAASIRQATDVAISKASKTLEKQGDEKSANALKQLSPKKHSASVFEPVAISELSAPYEAQPKSVSKAETKSVSKAETKSVSKAEKVSVKKTISSPRREEKSVVSLSQTAQAFVDRAMSMTKKKKFIEQNFADFIADVLKPVTENPADDDVCGQITLRESVQQFINCFGIISKGTEKHKEKLARQRKADYADYVLAELVKYIESI